MTAAYINNRKLLRHANSQNHNVRFYAPPNALELDSAIEENEEVQVRINTSSLSDKLNMLNRKLRNVDVVHKKEIINVIDIMENGKGHISSGDALSLIQICATHLVAESQESKLDTLHKVWNSLLKNGPSLDIRHYNFLLSSYNELEHMFSVSDFLTNIESAGLSPNQVTYQGLIHRYCQEGNVKAAKTILEFMKSKELSINVSIFNSLILGYVRSGNVGDAVGVLEAMKEVNLSADGESYSILISHHIQQGNMEDVQRLLQETKDKHINISTRDYMDIIYLLSQQQQPDIQFIQQILGEAKDSLAFNKFAIQVCWKLVTSGKEDIALLVVRSMNRRQYKNEEFQPSGSFFINQLVQLNRPYEVIVEYCKSLYDSGENKFAFTTALFAAYVSENYELAHRLAFDALYDHDIPVRGHYFWPLLNLATNKSEQEGWELLEKMTLHKASFNWNMIVNTLLPITTLEPEDLCKKVIDTTNCYQRTALHNLVDFYLNNNDLSKAARLVNKIDNLAPKADYSGTNDLLVNAYNSNTDTFSLLNLLTKLHKCTDRFSLPTLIAQLHHKHGPSIVTTLLKDLDSEGVGLSSDCCSNIKHTLRGQLSEENTKLLHNLTYQQTNKQKEMMPGVVMRSNLERVSGRLDYNQHGDRDAEISRLESQYTRMRSAGLVVSSEMLTDMLREFCRSFKLQKVRDIVQELEDRKYAFTNGQLALLLMLYSYSDELVDALRIYTSLEARKCTNNLDINKKLTFVQCLVKNDKYQSAVDVVREMDSKKVGVRDENIRTTKRLCDDILSMLSESGDVDKVEEMFNLLESRGLVSPNDFLSIHGQLVKVHIARNDINTALERAEEIYSKTGYLPTMQSLVVATLTCGNKDYFSRLVTMMRERFGEVTALHHLALGFIQIGSLQDARHLFETPGLKIKNELIADSCYIWLRENKRDMIENLLEVTDRVFDVNRGMIMFTLLQAWCREDNLSAAAEVFSQLRTEEINVSPSVLRYYATFLHKHKQDVPFEVPDEEDVKRYNEERNIKTGIDRTKPTITFENRGNVGLDDSDRNRLLGDLLYNKRIEDACTHVKEMYERGQGESIHKKQELTLYNQLANQGAVEDLQQFTSIVPRDKQYGVHLQSSLIKALVESGRAGEAVDGLEAHLQERVDGKHEEVMFPYHGVNTILQRYPSFTNQCLAIAEKYAEFGNQNPMFTMFNHYLMKKEYIAADKAWTTHLSDANEGVLRFGGMMDKLFDSKDLETAEKLIPFILNSNLSTKTKASNISRCIHLNISCRCAHKAVLLLDSCLHNEKFQLTEVAHSALVRLRNTCKLIRIPFNHNIDFIETTKDGADAVRREELD